VSEQNAEAGLGNRLVGRLCTDVFGAFPHTAGLATAIWVGNPVRANIARFDRPAIRPGALAAYRLDPGTPTIGLLGGSLGAGALNQAFAGVVESWSGPRVQFLQLAGERFAAEVSGRAGESGKPWTVVGFEPEMERFYAACDVVVSRAGGAVAELAVTATPAVLVPGVFGSGQHQVENARVFVEHGAGIMLAEDRLTELGALLSSLIADPGRLAALAAGTGRLAKPEAAITIARRLRGAHG
jgi:UDP-N-acetylglucosamine--N-acetylmuramyl-(pentapeptide) pyrophosphoryl-undecaprenol N-acetylglucosamine transferase